MDVLTDFWEKYEMIYKTENIQLSVETSPEICKSNLDPEITRQRLEAAQTTFMRSLYGVTERDIMRNVYIR
jgi:hypothetical protein